MILSNGFSQKNEPPVASFLKKKTFLKQEKTKKSRKKPKKTKKTKKTQKTQKKTEKNRKTQSTPPSPSLASEESRAREKTLPNNCHAGGFSKRAA